MGGERRPANTKRSEGRVLKGRVSLNEEDEGDHHTRKDIEKVVRVQRLGGKNKAKASRRRSGWFMGRMTSWPGQSLAKESSEAGERGGEG